MLHLVTLSGAPLRDTVRRAQRFSRWSARVTSLPMQPRTAAA